MNSPEDSVCALLLGEHDDGRLLIQQVFRDAGWRLLEACDRKKAQQHLNQDPIHVVIARCEAPGWDWKQVLRNLRRRAHPPQLIVTSRTADEHLWSEVLNCGGYDVLLEPFRRDEIERVVASARRHYDPQSVQAAGGPRSQSSMA
jgi:DNA-binding response OmpR family regulator